MKCHRRRKAEFSCGKISLHLPSRSRGFALVIALSLMILLTVLAVGLLSLSTISLRASTQGEAMRVARANARLALNLAIGELQKSAGPDQRITAPARIVSDSAPGWLAGAWKGVAPTSKEPNPQADANFVKYLISGGEGNAPSQTDLPDTTSGLELLGQKSLGGHAVQDQIVKAKPVDTADTHGKVAGRYAWAVLDEGVKARADLVRDTDFLKEQGKAANQIAMGAAARFGMEKVSDLDQFDWFGSEDQRKLYTLPTSRLIATSMEKLGSHQHDVTTVHTGLLTDAAHGGFKKDLSLLFKDEANLPGDYATGLVYDDEAVSRQASTATAPNANPRWSLLAGYANLYRNLSASSIGGYGINATLPAGYNPVRYDSRSRTNKVNPQPLATPLLSPVVAKMDMYFSFVCKDSHGNWVETIKTASGDPQRTCMLYMIYSPVVTLYNPYNVPITFSSLRIDFKDIPVGFRFFRNGRAQTSRLAAMNELYYYGLGAAGKSFGIDLKNALSGASTGSITLLPGENRVFGESVDGNWSWSANSGSFFDYQNDKTSNLPLAPGFPSPGVGLWVDWLTPPELATADDDDKQGVFSMRPSDQVDVEFGPMQSKATATTPNLSIELQLTAANGRKQRVGQFDLNYVSEANLKAAMTSANTTFPQKLQTPYVGNEIYESPATKLKDYTRAKTFAVFSFAAKTTLDSETPSKPWVQGAHSTNLVGIDLATTKMAVQPYEVSFKRTSPNVKFPINKYNRGRFFTGNSDANGIRVAPQFEIPAVPLQSIAQLRHAQIAAPGFLGGATYTAGESFANPMIPAAGVTASGPAGYALLDHTWLANTSLWDGYFFSTLSPSAGPLMNSGKTLDSLAGEFFKDGKKLLNPRFTPAAGGDPAAIVSQLTANDGYLNSASHLMVDGAFNINSTSVEAWKALLSSLNQSDVEYLQLDGEAETATTGQAASARNPFSRMRRAVGPSVDDNSNLINGRATRWNGMRTLSDQDLTALATHIVEEVKHRGPFLSLAQFVNRAPSSDSELSLKGALQTAIDKTPAINAPFDSDSRTFTAAELDGFANPKAMQGMNAEGAPGYLTQGDILSAIGAIVTPRSDTFRIRTCGEAVDTNGEVIARAWCEAVVQRTPDFVDASNTPSAATADLSETNQRFGRRFVVSSFRWLAKNEI